MCSEEYEFNQCEKCGLTEDEAETYDLMVIERWPDGVCLSEARLMAICWDCLPPELKDLGRYNRPVQITEDGKPVTYQLLHYAGRLPVRLSDESGRQFPISTPLFGERTPS